MKLADILEDNFRGDIRFRGEAYIKKEQIEIVRVTADAVFAEIDDDDAQIQSQLQREEGELKLYCNCIKGTTSPVLPSRGIIRRLLSKPLHLPLMTMTIGKKIFPEMFINRPLRDILPLAMVSNCSLG